MAFRILTPDELALLTDRQRENYEEELSIYQERVKLVEQLEKFENTVIPPYKPVLGKFSPVKKAPESAFAAPEHAVIAPEAKIKSAPSLPWIPASFLNVRMHAPLKPLIAVTDHHRLPEDLPRPLQPLIPLVCIPVAPDAKPAPNLQTKPDLNQSGKIAAPVLQANIPPVKCSLPQAQLTHAPETKAFAPVSTNSVTVKAPASPAIPQIGIPHTEPTTAQLPQVAPKGAAVYKFTAPSEAKAVQPGLPRPSAPAAQWSGSHTCHTQLPEVPRAGVPGVTFVWEAAGKPSLPTEKPVKVHTGTYCPPDTPKANIPTASGIALPEPITISRSAAETHIPSPAVCDAPSVNFRGVGHCAPNLPTSRRAAPDAYSHGAIRKLLRKNTDE